MARADRARQFMPFAALKGYFELILEQEEDYQPERELCDDDISEMSVKLQKLEKGKSVILEYYKNHSYVKRSGTITRLDHTMKWLMLSDEKIWYDDIVEIEDYVPKGRETWI